MMPSLALRGSATPQVSGYICLASLLQNEGHVGLTLILQPASAGAVFRPGSGHEREPRGRWRPGALESVSIQASRWGLKRRRAPLVASGRAGSALRSPRSTWV